MPRKTYTLNLDIPSLKRIFKTAYKNYDSDRKLALREFEKLVAQQNDSTNNNAMWSAGIPAQYLRIALDCNIKLSDLIKILAELIKKFEGKDVGSADVRNCLTEDQKRDIINLMDRRKSKDEEDDDDDEFEFDEDNDENDVGEM